MKYSYLLFDLDGTLFDYDRAESEALRQTFLDSEMEYHDIFLQNTERSINRYGSIMKPEKLHRII